MSFVALSLAPGDPLLARLDPEQLQRSSATRSCSRSARGVRPGPARADPLVALARGASRATSATRSSRSRPIAEESANASHPPSSSWDGARDRDHARRAFRHHHGAPAVPKARLHPVHDHDAVDQHPELRARPRQHLLFAVWLDILPSGGIQTLGEAGLSRTSCAHDPAGDGARLGPRRR